MKNAISLLIVLALILCNSRMQAQYGRAYSDFWYNYIQHSDAQNKELNKAAHLKQKQVLNADYSPSELTYVYDTAGRVTVYKSGKTEIRTSYVTGDQRLSTAFYKKGKLIERDSFVWVGNTLRESYSFDGRNKMFNKQRFTYDSTYLTEFVFEKLKKGKFIEYKRNVMEYYPDYSYKKITYYKYGKPKYFTVFDCNPAGQNHKVEKDSAYTCVKYDVDSLGNKIKISLTNEKTYSWKQVEYFNKQDECIARKTYDQKKNGELLWAYYFKPGKKQEITKFISYKGSKEYYRVESEFDAKDNAVASATYVRGKLRNRHQNSYNERGLIAKTEKFKKNKKTKEITYLYQYY